MPNFSFERPLHQLAYTTDYFATALAMSDNGSFFAQAHANSRNEIAIDVYVTDTGTHFGRLYGHDAPIRSLEFSSDGQLLVSGDDDGQVIVWSVGTKSEIRRFEDQKSYGTGSLEILPTMVAISDDGTKLAFGGQTETVTVRAVSGAKVYARINLHSGSENPSDFGAVGLNTMRMGVVTLRERLPEFYQRASQQLRNIREPIVDIAFSTDGSQIGVISYGTLNDVHVFDVTGELIAQLSCRVFDSLGAEIGGSFHPQNIAFAPFSHEIYFSGNVAEPNGLDRGSGIRSWSGETNSCTNVLYSHPEPSSLLGLGLTFEGSRIALGGKGRIIIVDTVTGLQAQRIADEELFGFECSGDKNFMISAGSSGSILSACGFDQPTIFAQ